ncbi:MAG: winged helix-turn-helix transcriptional regulator [Chloroflexota bacterium]
MYRYGQYCPVARATEILGDRWTLLIIRDLLNGTRHFNDLVRGLPGISRALLADRLERLEREGVIEKRNIDQGRRTTEYQLTDAGEQLADVLQALLEWGAKWAFGEPRQNELDPVLLLWWMRNRVHRERLPQERVVVQFDFDGAPQDHYWLVLTREDVSVCLNYPGFQVDVLVTADLAIFHQIWLGRLSYGQALREHEMTVEAIPALRSAFPDWFALSQAADTVRAMTAQ